MTLHSLLYANLSVDGRSTTDADYLSRGSVRIAVSGYQIVTDSAVLYSMVCTDTKELIALATLCQAQEILIFKLLLDRKVFTLSLSKRNVDLIIIISFNQFIQLI